MTTLDNVDICITLLHNVAYFSFPYLLTGMSIIYIVLRNITHLNVSNKFLVNISLTKLGSIQPSDQKRILGRT